MFRWREWIKEIVSFVNSSLVKEEDDIEEVFIHPTVSVKSAFFNFQFSGQQRRNQNFGLRKSTNAPAEFSYDRNILFKIRSLKSDLLAYQILKKKQTSIDSYIEVSIVIVI